MSSHDSRYFSSHKKGEIAEWRQDLKRNDRDLLKTTVKRIIAAMTVGKDVCSLFPDVINCMQTEDIELKKLIYLYSINYARSNPDLAILAVNTFVKDSQDPNPLIRALAVRTMGCIRVDRIVEYLCDPLHLALRDSDPYVRKTAAICVAKLYSINRELVIDRGFLQQLNGLLLDDNPMVMANSIAALVEIQKGSCAQIIDSSLLSRVFTSLEACTEWGKVTILDCLAAYESTSATEAEHILESILPKLQHANYAVVLACIRVILSKLHQVQHLRESLLQRIVPPLITMLNAEPEIQYVALTSISEIMDAFVFPFLHSYKAFFCKYNDPSYVKHEKLNILVKITNENNVGDILLELKEYSGEVDIEFARKAIRSIGICALSVPEYSQGCVSALMCIIDTKVNYAVQEALVVLKDIFRCYPDRYESVISRLCQSLVSLDEPEAKKSFIWILGEYADRIENVIDLLRTFIDGVDDEPVVVQLQLLTSTVKLFLKRPSEESKSLVQQMLMFATHESEHPDLRDRAYVYWRLLSHGGDKVASVVTSHMPAPQCNPSS
ncbi:Beta adaptin-like protein [Ostreococcus lucimarinus CCE9901]|uniref:Beta-adaptin-like protein n=1 Tax=Ostreococcus lucimarinus (strain CCE9901) TaxID=436017 RepID=A4RSR1_OSTLU|nr:Beta adaptin-like protein [Ostreococcus lucimarinus CCE9901]ABO94494.1 Beta adaptin-like protein [Ostreococcus lucimarinus CCE9901]|eukprot:XP_001416201.1 Beta adaptin-like protein [Ostreococcus lucimarinus CCE9901]